MPSVQPQARAATWVSAAGLRPLIGIDEAGRDMEREAVERDVAEKVGRKLNVPVVVSGPTGSPAAR